MKALCLRLKLFSLYLGLTPAEMEFANLVKHGKTTTEIAELLNLSGRTIDKTTELVSGGNSG
jgi:DNA-binding CsgD family transcriptional regulator